MTRGLPKKYMRGSGTLKQKWARYRRAKGGRKRAPPSSNTRPRKRTMARRRKATSRRSRKTKRIPLIELGGALVIADTLGLVDVGTGLLDGSMDLGAAKTAVLATARDRSVLSAAARDIILVAAVKGAAKWLLPGNRIAKVGNIVIGI